VNLFDRIRAVRRTSNSNPARSVTSAGNDGVELGQELLHRGIVQDCLVNALAVEGMQALDRGEQIVELEPCRRPRPVVLPIGGHNYAPTVADALGVAVARGLRVRGLGGLGLGGLNGATRTPRCGEVGAASSWASSTRRRQREDFPTGFCGFGNLPAATAR
jgi:hypothetical protein